MVVLMVVVLVGMVLVGIVVVDMVRFRLEGCAWLTENRKMSGVNSWH
jgi:hypothetical protein